MESQLATNTATSAFVATKNWPPQREAGRGPLNLAIAECHVHGRLNGKHVAVNFTCSAKQFRDRALLELLEFVPFAAKEKTGRYYTRGSGLDVTPETGG